MRTAETRCDQAKRKVATADARVVELTEGMEIVQRDLQGAKDTAEEARRRVEEAESEKEAARRALAGSGTHVEDDQATAIAKAFAES